MLDEATAVVEDSPPPPPPSPPPAPAPSTSRRVIETIASAASAPISKFSSDSVCGCDLRPLLWVCCCAPGRLELASKYVRARRCWRAVSTAPASQRADETLRGRRQELALTKKRHFGAARSCVSVLWVLLRPWHA